ncbi:MAG: recombination-associated protein RdgC [Burkholderiales bacterium]|jgi:recombination associated protein RdgC|nr:recombination-associated protein RdgC [Burkholderiales bacterium]
MFKNALVYRITQWDQPELHVLEEKLSANRFAECGASQAESFGWVEPRGEKHGPMVEVVGGQLMMRIVIETKAVPSSAVKTRLEAELDKIEADTGRRPKGKRAKELKEQIVHELLPRAFSKRSSTLVWIDAKAKLVIVDAASTKKADRIVTLLVDVLGGGIILKLLQTESSPSTAMSQWLKSKEAPAGFSVDRECELKQPDSEKALVKYARHNLDIDEVGLHIEQGKVPTQLALTWDNRVSFVLTEAMTIKKIKLLDVVLEGAAAQEGGFDTDVAIATGELSQLIPNLIEALDGEQVIA